MPIVHAPPAELRLGVDPAALGFADTSELASEPLPWIGQERAEQAARFGLQMAQPDYHLFVLGEVGSGRSTLMLQVMQAEAARRPVPPDLCYLHNFETPEHPRALRLPAGEGRLLRQMMADFASTLPDEIPKRLDAPDVKSVAERLRGAAKLEDDQDYASLSRFAEARRFGLLRENGRMVFTQRDDKGEPLTAEKALTLSHEQRVAIDAAEDELRAEIGRFIDKARVRELQLKEKLDELQRRTIKPMLERSLQAIRSAMRKQIKDSLKLGRYLDDVQHDLLENLALFLPAEESDEMRAAALIELLSRLRVNVVVDHHAATGAPVIVDDNPVFRSLFGSIEYESENDVLVTDFSRIRAGSLLKAHGGFLMLHLRDLVADPLVWEKLRRFLRSGRLQIEEPTTIFSPMATVSLEPEPVDADVKLVLIASVEDYYAVQEGDPEFARRFRCKVDFADSFAAEAATRQATAIFVAHTCRRLGLPHFNAAAVAALLEDAHREAEDQRRQSAIFAHTEVLLMEAAMLARQRGAALVDASDVAAARQARVHRHNAVEERLLGTLTDGDRLMSLDGHTVGQVNGLTVIDLGDHAFGFPVRVSARTHAGDKGLINIEREVKLSGPIHDKVVLILHGHLASLFEHIAPLALNASVVFEQEYSGIEGDSASCAEFFALLSSLSGLPIDQSIAVTGAINQHGEVLPVGGINEKIEGWFKTCEQGGLTGQQGVLIPARNRRHLMLDAHVVDAVARGAFHIHTADTAAEGLALLTGADCGTREAGSYPPDSVLGRAEQTLLAYRRACQAMAQPKQT